MKQNRSWIIQICAIGIAICLGSFSVGIIFSISPLYITSVLGITIASIGILEGITEALAQLSKLASGVFTDYFKKKKPLLVFAFLMSALSKPIFILAGGFNLILTSKLIERLSNGLMATPRDLYVVDIAPPKRKSSCLGIIMTFKFLGIIGGSLLSAYLIYLTNNNYTLIMWVGFALSMLAVIILILFMRDVERPNDESLQSKKRVINWSEIKSMNKYYWFILFIATIFMATRFSEAFIILYMNYLNCPTEICASVIAIQNLTSFITCAPIGYVSDRIGIPITLAITILIHCLANFCFLIADGLLLGLMGVVLWGIQRAASQILFISLISNVVDQKILGTAIGIFHLITGVAALFASIIAGWLATNSSFESLFNFGLSVSLFSLVVFVIYHYFPKKVFAKAF